VVNYNTGTLQAYNVSVPTAPVLRATVATDTAPLAVAASGSTVCVVSGGYSNPPTGTMQVFDAPTATTLERRLSSITAESGTSSPVNVVMSGSMAYVSNYGGTLQVLSLPSQPRTLAVNPDGSFSTIPLPGSNAFIQNQVGSPQAGNFSLSGSGYVGGIMGVGSATSINEYGQNYKLQVSGDAYASGKLALGTTYGGNHKLYVSGTGYFTNTVSMGYNCFVYGMLGINNSNPSYRLDVGGQIRCSGAVVTTSGQRLKQDIRPLGQALAGVQRLRGVRYTFRQAEFPDKSLPGGEQIGVLAQELAQVYPELVSTDQQGFKSVNYAQLTPVLIEAVKELAARNATLETQAAADHASLLTMQARK